MKEKKKMNKIILKIAIVCISIIIGGNIVLATDDPLSVINNMSNFIFSIVRGIGMILILWGIVQIGLALKSHDPSQRANGFMTLARSNYNYFFKRNIKFNNRWVKRASKITCSNFL